MQGDRLTFTVPTADLERLLVITRLQAKELLEGHRYVDGNPLLSVRYEAARRSVTELGQTLARMKISQGDVH